MRLIALAAPLACAALAACVSVTDNSFGQTAPIRAAVGDFGEATLIDGTGARVGRAVLTQGATGLLIRVEASGLTPGWHGMHIHATGECTAPLHLGRSPYQPHRSQDAARPAECPGA